MLRNAIRGGNREPKVLRAARQRRADIDERNQKQNERQPAMQRCARPLRTWGTWSHMCQPETPPRRIVSYNRIGTRPALQRLGVNNQPKALACVMTGEST